MEKCNCWELTNKRMYGDGYNYTVPIQICNGTKEREECSCDGNESKCNFYPEKRKEKKMTTLEMMNQAALDGKTYKADDMRYNRNLGFHDIQGRRWNADAFTYVNEIFSIDKWQLKPDNEMTKSEAEAKFNIKIVGN